jgi:hypothetical protein
MPVVFLVMTAAFPLMWLLSKPLKQSLPFDMPEQANRIDPGDLDPTGKPQRAGGHVMIGVERKTGKQVWLSNRKVTQHLLLPGTTGSGKSAMILGLISNAVSQGSGVFEIDAKGDLKFMHQIIALARMFGRDADVRILNFLNSDPFISESFNSNTFNMLSMAPADDISSLISSMRVSMGKDNQSFEGRGTALVSAVVGALVWLRDNLDIPLSVVELRDCMMNVDRLIGLAFGCDANGVEYKATADFWPYSDAIWTFLITFVTKPQIISYAQTTLNINVAALRNLDPANQRVTPAEGKIETSEMQRQHGFAIMTLTSVFQNIIGDYKRIFGCSSGDVTLDDAVKNRRIVIALLPSLGKSKSDTLSASKILVSNIRGMTSRALGTKTYGPTGQLLAGQITNANSPFLIVFEEAGPYVQEGMDQLYQQSRSLNFWIVTAFQDLPGLERNDAAIARSIVGNANYALFMRIQDPTFTGKLAKEQGDNVYASLVRSFEEKTGMFDRKRSVDSPNFSIERMDRVSFQDLQSQRVGQATMIAEGKVVRINAFYCEPLSCVPKHRMISNIRRFASWRLPLAREITLEPLEPRKSNHVRGEEPSGRPAARKPNASPAAPSPVSKGVGAPSRAAAAEKNNDFAASIANTSSKSPLFATPAAARAPGNATSRPAVPSGVQAQTAPAFDPYVTFIDGLKASQEMRMDHERTCREFLNLQVERPGPVSVFDEFAYLSYVGIDLCRSTRATMDFGTFTTGAICLAGIRGRFRKDGKLPPFLPRSWTTRRSLDEEINSPDWDETVGAEAAFRFDNLPGLAVPLGENDYMPVPSYMKARRPADQESDMLPDEDPDGEPEDGEALITGSQSMSSLDDELRRLLDRD